jgi:hypothetical protein
MKILFCADLGVHAMLLLPCLFDLLALALPWHAWFCSSCICMPYLVGGEVNLPSFTIIATIISSICYIEHGVHAAEKGH